MDLINWFNFGFDWSAGYDFPRDLYIALAVGLIGYAVVYAFEAISLYTIGKRNGYGKLYMAFIPFLNTYYMGVVAEKNKVFNIKTKNFSLALAIFEAVMVIGYALYYISFFALRGTGYIEYEYVEIVTGSELYYLSPVLNSSTIPATMAWMSWCVKYLGTVMSYLELAYVIIDVFVLIAFFQTYAHGRYVIMSIFSAILPIGGIIMFFVRKNKPMNYRDYVRMVQERQYRMYRQNQQYGNPYNYNPYEGNPNNYNNTNYNNPNYNNPNYNNGASNSANDPFDEFGSNGSSNGSSGSSDSQTQEDPFEDF